MNSALVTTPDMFSQNYCWEHSWPEERPGMTKAGPTKTSAGTKHLIQLGQKQEDRNLSSNSHTEQNQTINFKTMHVLLST